MLIKETVLLLAIILAVLSLLFIPVQVENHPDGSRSVSGFFVLSRSSEYEINASVIEVPDNNQLGISLDYTELNFGYIPLGSRVTKYLNLSSQTPVKMHLNVKGDIKDFVTFDKDDFILSGSTRVPVTFQANETGNFSGMVEITANKPRYGWLSWIMGWI
jgi:hypothetical protein